MLHFERLSKHDFTFQLSGKNIFCSSFILNISSSLISQSSEWINPMKVGSKWSAKASEKSSVSPVFTSRLVDTPQEKFIKELNYRTWRSLILQIFRNYSFEIYILRLLDSSAHNKAAFSQNGFIFTRTRQTLLSTEMYFDLCSHLISGYFWRIITTDNHHSECKWHLHSEYIHTHRPSSNCMHIYLPWTAYARVISLPYTMHGEVLE